MRSRKEIGKTIADLRKAAGLSQHDLAPRAGISRSTLANIEAGRQGTPLETLAPLAEALGSTVAAILGEQDQDVVPAALVAQVVAHQQRIVRAMGELAGTMAFLESETQRLSEILNTIGKPACSCCGRKVAPLDADGRCGHCGANRAAGTHAGDAPCRPVELAFTEGAGELFSGTFCVSGGNSPSATSAHTARPYGSPRSRS